MAPKYIGSIFTQSQPWFWDLVSISFNLDMALSGKFSVEDRANLDIYMHGHSWSTWGPLWLPECTLTINNSRFARHTTGFSGWLATFRYPSCTSGRNHGCWIYSIETYAVADQTVSKCRAPFKHLSSYGLSIVILLQWMIGIGCKVSQLPWM